MEVLSTSGDTGNDKWSENYKKLFPMNHRTQTYQIRVI